MLKDKNTNLNSININMILKELLNTDLITTKKLAEVVNLSEKTVRTKLKLLNDYLADEGLGSIKTKPRFGVWLDVTNEQKIELNSRINGQIDMDYMQSDQARFSQALKMILKAGDNNNVTTKKMAEMMYLSVPTVLKILHECKEWLKMFNIELEIVRNKGIVIRYTEVAYRLAIKHFIMKFLVYEQTVEESINYFMPNINLDVIKKTIIDTEKEWNFEFAEESFNEIMIYVAASLYRNSINKRLEIERKELEDLKSYNEYSFADAIFKKCSELLDIQVTKEDIAFLSIQILCSKVIDIGYGADATEILDAFNNKLKDFVAKIVSVVSNILNVDLTGDENLYHGLVTHLRPCIFRLRYERSHTNTLTDYIKNEYETTFRVSWVISVLFEEYWDLQITEDELGYIVLYIQTALERNAGPVNTILVSGSGMGINQLLCDKIKRNFAMIKEVHVVSYHDFDINEHKSANIILTTKKLKDDPRVVEIDEFLSDSSIKKIGDMINNIYAAKDEDQNRFPIECHQMFEPDLIFCNVEVEDKATLIKMMCDKLIEKGYITENYFRTVIERENITSTAVGRVAIPHGDQKYINEAKVVIATLKNPIEWGGDMVDVVFLLVVKMNNDYEIRKTQQFYKQYIKLVETDERLNFLRSFEHSVDFYKFLIK